MTPQQANERKPCPFCDKQRGHADDCYFHLVGIGAEGWRIEAAWNRRAPAPTSEPGASIRDHEDFREDLLRLSTTQHRQTLKAIRKDIYDTIDRRVANAVAAALATPASPTTVCAPNCFYGDCPPCVAAGIAPASPAEHVAEVGSTYQLVWAGSGPIASIVEKHGLKVGSKLYAHPAADPAPLVAQASPSVPSGWKLVPPNPTDDMVVAFAEAWYMKRQSIDDPEMDDAYAAMLAASPLVEDAQLSGNSGELVEDAQRIVVGKVESPVISAEVYERAVIQIEREIDDQLTASGMSPRDMYRQDGEIILNAIMDIFGATTGNATADDGKDK